ncbi:hypothetical protein HOLDEFILI_02847 [Holdemania filiformis DSM 12042]|uniref:Uncharacterized protein n=1 Tax=Holdemania filiformis DSM 12042 TaxID=545696 RepID=B9YAJ0_9FIRM|nr:hypothetical protein HOLDEFILI_02847 [Holdemania filiformis DSM 12042]
MFVILSLHHLTALQKTGMTKLRSLSKGHGKSTEIPAFAKASPEIQFTVMNYSKTIHMAMGE